MGCFYYTDDTTVICSGVTTDAFQTTMCSYLSIIQQQVLQSKMEINFRKSSVRVSSCSTGFSYSPISIDGVELTVTKKQKYLRLIFDCNLSWAYHVSSKLSYYLVLIALYEEDALGIAGVVSSILLFSGLGSLPWKHFAIETSKNAESCSETVHVL